MRKLVIILDPAHGEEVPGKGSPDGTHKEYKWSREICEKLKTHLTCLGFRVEITNPTDKEIGLSRRKEFASKVNTNPGEFKFLVSLHNNAAGWEMIGQMQGDLKSILHLEILLLINLQK